MKWSWSLTPSIPLTAVPLSDFALFTPRTAATVYAVRATGACGTVRKRWQLAGRIRLGDKQTMSATLTVVGSAPPMNALSRAKLTPVSLRLLVPSSDPLLAMRESTGLRGRGSGAEREGLPGRLAWVGGQRAVGRNAPGRMRWAWLTPPSMRLSELGSPGVLPPQRSAETVRFDEQIEPSSSGSASEGLQQLLPDIGGHMCCSPLPRAPRLERPLLVALHAPLKQGGRGS